MSGTLVRGVAAVAACVVALGGCDARTGADDGASGAGAQGADGGDVTFSGGGDRVTFSDGGPDAVTFSSGTDRVTFSGGGQDALTFSSSDAASFASAPASSPEAGSAAADLGEAGDPDAVDFVETPDTVGTNDLGDTPDTAGETDPGEAPETATDAAGGTGPSGTATRGGDPRFGFWDGDEVGAPIVSDDHLFRIAAYGDEIWLEWFADETREGGSGENCWSPYLTSARLEREGDLFVRNMGDEGATRVEYSYDDETGLLVERMYLQDELRYTERYLPELDGVAFTDFLVCRNT